MACKHWQGDARDAPQGAFSSDGLNPHSPSPISHHPSSRSSQLSQLAVISASYWLCALLSLLLLLLLLLRSNCVHCELRTAAANQGEFVVCRNKNVI
jgi:hypothetical protein